MKWGDQQTLWTRGGFPRSYLAASDEASVRWREVYMRTYFEQDLAALGMAIPPQRILKLWAMLTQCHGNIMNFSSMAQFMDVPVPKIKSYIALLEGTFMIRTLSPWYENLGKRLVKTPKLYIRDSGIFHQLLGVNNYPEVVLNTHRGASWEGFALEEITKALNVRPEECYFWATHQMAEIDLFLIYKGQRIGFEFKCTDQPKITKSMSTARQELGLQHLYIVTPVEETFPLDSHTTVLALKDTFKIVNQSI